MRVDELSLLLNEAVQEISKIPANEKKELLQWPGLLPPQLSKLNDFLEKDPDLKLFENKMRVLESSSSLVHYIGLAKWLTHRALDVGVDKTINDLENYTQKSKFKYYQVVALLGIQIDSELQLSDNIKLVPFSLVPKSQEKEMLESGSLFGMIAVPRAALVREKFHVVKHIEENNSADNYDNETTWREEFEDALLCIATRELVGISSLMSWLVIDDSVPLANFYIGGGFFRRHIFGPIVPKIIDVTTSAPKIHKEFTDLKEEDKQILRVAMSRLNTAMLDHASVNSAIDVRVALESIFLAKDGGMGEYTFKIRLRASRFLSDDLDERMKLYSLFKDLYELGSIAIHKGKLENKKGNTPSQLKDGYRYISEAIEKIIFNKGFPEWNKIDLS